jgi:hypothetical protein
MRIDLYGPELLNKAGAIVAFEHGRLLSISQHRFGSAMRHRLYSGLRRVTNPSTVASANQIMLGISKAAVMHQNVPAVIAFRGFTNFLLP